MMLKLTKRIGLSWIKELWLEKLIYLYFSTIDNKTYIKNYRFALRNFLINWLKYCPLCSKFLKLSKEAPAGLNKIIFFFNCCFFISKNISLNISFKFFTFLTTILLFKFFLYIIIKFYIFMSKYFFRLWICVIIFISLIFYFLKYFKIKRAWRASIPRPVT